MVGNYEIFRVEHNGMGTVTGPPGGGVRNYQLGVWYGGCRLWNGATAYSRVQLDHSLFLQVQVQDVQTSHHEYSVSFGCPLANHIVTPEPSANHEPLPLSRLFSFFRVSSGKFSRHVRG